MLSCELIEDFGRLQELSDHWDRLWRDDPNAEIFQSFPWVKSWWLSYGHKFTLSVLCVYSEKTVIGFLPLVRQGETLQFLAQQQSDYCDIVCDDQFTLRVLAIGLETLLKLPSWKACILHNLKPNGRLLSHWKELSPRLRSRVQVFPGTDCRTLLLDSNRDVLTSLIKKDHTRRRLNKLRKAGSLTFRHIEEKQEAQRYLSQFFKQHVRRHVLLGKISSSEHPEFRKLLRTLVDELDLTNCLRFGVLELNAHPLAWHFSFEVNGKLVFYQQTFDVEAWDYAPGEVLVHQLLLYGQQNLDREIDFTRGDEVFKDRFTTHTRKTYSVYFDRPALLGRIRQLTRSATLPLIRVGQVAAKLTKSNPRLLRAFRTARLCTKGLFELSGQDEPPTLAKRTTVAFRRGLRMADLHRKEIEVLVAPLTATIINRDVRAMTREGSFGDLVDISKANPDVITPFELPKYRRRLKRGDRVYLVTENGTLVLAAWANTTKPGDVFRLNSKGGIFDWSYDVLVYDWWATRDVNGDDFKSLLRLVLSTSKLKCKDGFAVCCPASLPQLRTELIQSGYSSRYWLSGQTLSHSLRIRSAASGEHGFTLAKLPKGEIALNSEEGKDMQHSLQRHESTVLLASHSRQSQISQKN